MPTLEEAVQAEQEDHDAGLEADKAADAEAHDTPPEAAAEPIVEADGQAVAFDRDQYAREDLAIAKVDGNEIDRIALSFGGTIMLDRSDPADVALYNRLTLGKGDVTLMVEGKCSATGAKQATNRDGELDVIVGAKTVKVTTVYVPAVEDLAGELARTAEAE